jgi:serine/threonine-protein kinase
MVARDPMQGDEATTPLAGSTPGTAAPAGAEEELAPGALAGAWRVEGLIARGGHGLLYAATHRATGRRAALKVLQRRFAEAPGMAARFVREGVILSRLRHPAVVEYLELGLLADGRPFCAMELLEGQTLQDLLRSRGRLAPEEAAALLGPVCAALDAAHASGIVHRDVKSSNVFLAGDPPAPRLLDFGVAKPTAREADALTAVGERVGSAHAMSPEQIRGDSVDARTDVYALGVLLHQMLTGAMPFSTSEPYELERLHLEAEPPAPSRSAPVPAAVDAVVLRAMAKDPKARFTSAGAFHDALSRAAASAPAGPPAAPAGAEAAAVGVHVAIVPAGAGEAEALAQAQLEAEAEGALAEAGLELDVRAPGALLATRLLPRDPEPARAERARVVASARDLAARLAGRAGGDARVRVTVHAAPVLLGEDGARVGGPLFRTAEWVDEGGGAFEATPAALAG